MTAVNPARLRHQTQSLMGQFTSPVEFRQALRTLFSLYANYSLRFGETAPMRPLIPMYHLPHPVMRQIKLDLGFYISENPHAALALADELWEDSYYEVKHTALFIIGAMPVENPQLILDRIMRWLSPDLDQVLKSDLFMVGTRNLQDSFPQAWESWVFSLLSDTDPAINSLGIQALAAGAKSPGFHNLPAIFRLASPFIRDPHRAFIQDLENLMIALAKISPQETGYYLRQTLATSISPETPWLIKNCLASFPKDIQADLISALQKE
ncbi:MAG TPA: hypothetical protein PLR56_02595 [Brevefilum sp.]|nr:hypothetical protein [Brevefilum sp.]